MRKNSSSQKRSLALSQARQKKVQLLAAFARRGGASIHEALFSAFQPLVSFVAYRFNKKQGDVHPLNELIGAGHVGLLDAFAAYAPGKLAGDCRVELARFNALAAPLIRAAIERSVCVHRTAALQHARRLELAETVSANVQDARQSLPTEVELMLAILRLRQQSDAMRAW